MSAMEFLTTPDVCHPSDHSSPDQIVRRAPTNATATTASVENGVYFGFVNMTKPKSMLRTNAKESFKYCTIVAILFFLWGISYGLLNTLNNAIAIINDMTDAQTLGLTSAYFGGGYFFGPLLVGEWLLRRDEHNRSKRHEKDDAENVGGYKVTFIMGLCIYGIGTIIFWPSAVTNSYGGFMLSSFVVGFGLSVLEVAANSFLVLCGPPEYGETRLLLAQAVQGVGSVVSGLLAQKVFFTSIGVDDKNTSNSMTLINVQWTYLGITLFCVILALFFYYMPLPEVSDSELELSTNRLPINPQKRCIGGLQLRTVSLILAVFAQYVYVAAQESNSIYFHDLLSSMVPANKCRHIQRRVADVGPRSTAGSRHVYTRLPPRRAHRLYHISRAHGHCDVLFRLKSTPPAASHSALHLCRVILRLRPAVGCPASFQPQPTRHPRHAVLLCRGPYLAAGVCNWSAWPGPPD